MIWRVCGLCVLDGAKKRATGRIELATRCVTTDLAPRRCCADKGVVAGLRLVQAPGSRRFPAHARPPAAPRSGPRVTGCHLSNALPPPIPPPPPTTTTTTPTPSHVCSLPPSCCCPQIQHPSSRPSNVYLPLLRAHTGLHSQARRQSKYESPPPPFEFPSSNPPAREIAPADNPPPPPNQ